MYSRGIARFYDLFDDECGQPGPECTLVEQLASPGSTLLDIGAGVGNTALGLAAAGFRVTALEPDPEMFSVLMARLAVRNELHRNLSPVPKPSGFPLGSTFETCLCLNVLHLQSERERKAVFECASTHLALGGRFIFNAPTNSSARAERARGLAAERSFGEVSVQHFSALHQLPSGMWRTTWEFVVMRAGRVLEHTSRFFDWQPIAIDELNALAAASGLAVQATYADFQRSPFVEGESRTATLVARSLA